VALCIANALGYDAARLKNLYIAACSHDIGAVEAFTESHHDSNYIYEHSEFGSNIIKKLPIDGSISRFIRFHHENWDGSGPNGLSGSSIPEEAQIIHIADLFELVYSSERPYWSQREHILEWMKSKGGSR
jgi:HD-GYP domain-containing protein (c-di-GMP phosphodiesterase class II)